MTLKEFLVANNLFQYVKYLQSIQLSLNRCKIDRFKVIHNGFVLLCGRSLYKVTLEKDSTSYYYHLEKSDGILFLRVPCMTQAEERAFPKCPAWVGTALIERAYKQAS